MISRVIFVLRGGILVETLESMTQMLILTLAKNQQSRREIFLEPADHMWSLVMEVKILIGAEPAPLGPWRPELNLKGYFSLAPTFFKFMTTSTNNWMLIKIIKLFGALTPLEPRLGKKLIEPLTNLIHSTSAMSLLYECINTVIAVLISISTGMPNHAASIQLCVQKLRILIEDSDQNLKYLGLLAMSKILKTSPKSVSGHKDLVLGCLDDADESIRLRALDLLSGMVSKKNLMEIVKKLMTHMAKAEGTTYRDELLNKIIQICCQNDYQYISNFEWYVSVLVELSQMDGGGGSQNKVRHLKRRYHVCTTLTLDPGGADDGCDHQGSGDQTVCHPADGATNRQQRGYYAQVRQCQGVAEHLPISVD